MGFSEAIKSVFSNYTNFSGRARRSEYWFFMLFNFIISISFNIISFILGLISGFDEENIIAAIFMIILGLIAIVVSLILIIPGLAVSVRRLHDVGKSGWFILLGFIPLVGPIILLIFYLTDSEAGDNMYGPNPKGM